VSDVTDHTAETLSPIKVIAVPTNWWALYKQQAAEVAAMAPPPTAATRNGRACKAVLRINNTNYSCDLNAPHPGTAHHNDTANAVWCSDGEARKHQQQKTRPNPRRQYERTVCPPPPTASPAPSADAESGNPQTGQ